MTYLRSCYFVSFVLIHLLLCRCQHLLLSALRICEYIRIYLRQLGTQEALRELANDGHSIAPLEAPPGLIRLEEEDV